VRSRVYLRRPTSADRDGFLALVHASRTLHRPWSHPPATPEAFAAFVERSHGAADTSFVCRREDDAIAGVMSISDIVMRSLRGGALGYYALEPLAGKGYMAEGLQLILRRAFGELRLHRIEAAIQPGNARSIRLVSGAGFRLEGNSPRFLKIGGRWRDHERWAILAEEHGRHTT
jgi:ribosomal-protein-alanine N-acetyltransferase